jgi:hypothetical protein
VLSVQAVASPVLVSSVIAPRKIGKDLFKLIWYAVAGPFRSRAALQTEVLRHQLNVLRRRAPKRVAVSNIDRLVFVGLYHLAPEVLDAMRILEPETIIKVALRWVPSEPISLSAAPTALAIRG